MRKAGCGFAGPNSIQATPQIHREPAELHTLTGVLHGVRGLDSGAVIQLGLVLLIATPVVRVALTLVAFVWQRDRLTWLSQPSF